MKIINKIKHWRKHHKIELFGAVIGSVFLLLLVDLVFISAHVKAVNKNFLKTQAVYVSEFKTSLSGKTGQIAQVYVNPDHTKCVILLHFDSTDNIVTDASQYQVYVKGFDLNKGNYAKKTLSNPVGGFYMFGSTGYSAIYLADANGFAQQCLECIVRCNEVLTTDVKVNDEEAAKRDGSYAEHDQWRVIINPIGESAKTCDFLDDFDIVSLYQDAVIDANEDEIRAQLISDVSNLDILMKQIQSYREDLQGLGVRVPSLPDYISGDTFKKDEDGNIIYSPGQVLEGGVNFEWVNNTLHDKSFMDEVKEPSLSDTQFFNSLNTYAVTQRSTSEKYWYMADGTQIDRTNTNNSVLTNLKTINNNITKYETSLSDYSSLKKQYQCTDLVNYLALESNMRSAGKYFTSNYDENTVIVW